MRSSTATGALEEDLAYNLWTALATIFEGQAVTSRASSDGVIYGLSRGCSIPLVVIEYKRALGDGGCDPLTQASHSAWKIWREKNVCAIDAKESDVQAFTFNSCRKSATGPAVQPSSLQAVGRTWRFLGSS